MILEGRSEVAGVDINSSTIVGTPCSEYNDSPVVETLLWRVALKLQGLQGRIQKGGWGGCNTLFFRQRQGNSMGNERSHALSYQLSCKLQEYTGNDCFIPASRIFLVNLGTSGQICRVVAILSSALAAGPHLERATIIARGVAVAD